MPESISAFSYLATDTQDVPAFWSFRLWLQMFRYRSIWSAPLILLPLWDFLHFPLQVPWNQMYNVLVGMSVPVQSNNCMGFPFLLSDCWLPLQVSLPPDLLVAGRQLSYTPDPAILWPSLQTVHLLLSHLMWLYNKLPEDKRYLKTCARSIHTLSFPDHSDLHNFQSHALSEWSHNGLLSWYRLHILSFSVCHLYSHYPVWYHR